MGTFREDWDRRAVEDGRGYTASHDHETEAKYVESGARDAGLLLDFARLDPAHTYERALEIGSGLGRLLEFMAGRFSKVTGADVSPEMIRRAEERLGRSGKAGRCEFLLVDGDGRIPTQEKFDFVYTYTVFQHILPRQTARYIEEVRRLLKDDGVAVLHFAEPYGLRRHFQALFHIDPAKDDTFHFRYFRPAEVRRLCRKAGLRVQEHMNRDAYGFYRVTVDKV